MTIHQSEHCMVCRNHLNYLDNGEKVVCMICGREESSAIICPAGHYVCNTCHSVDTLELLPRFAQDTGSEAPEDILEELLAVPKLPMHGPEHHAMPGLALLLSCERAGIKLPENFIEETIRRCMQIPGGTCGYHGACGGAISLGVAVSIITGATPVRGLARGMAHRASAAALLKCGDDEARCCKRALRKTVTTGREFFAEEFGIELPQPRTLKSCNDISRNNECVKGHCPYFHRIRAAKFQ